MESLDLKQMSAMVDLIAEEKGLEKDTVLNVIEQAIAAAWRKENGDREMNVRATLNTQTGEADAFVARTVVEDGEAYNPATEVPLSEAKQAVEAGTSKLIAKASAQTKAESEDAGAEAIATATSAEAVGDNAEKTDANENEGEATENADANENPDEETSENETEATDEEAEPEAEAELGDEAELGGEVEVGDIVEEKIPVKSFGRVAAMTAKQVVIQRLREAENDAVLAEYEDKIGTVVTGTVARIEPKLVRIDLGRASGIMPRSEQIDGEYYVVGHRIKVYIEKIERGDRGTQLILSRGNTEFIKYLFQQEVPELTNGTVEIKGIAREAGRRTKIAVVSTVPGIDPVGTFVGGRGIRVQAVMNEIGDREKIDIINWSDNASEYIREALSPAEISKVEIDGKKAKVLVTEDQQKIAIGTKGQNVRLASKLTGYDIDIELVKNTGKKKKQNIEDSLLSAIEESEEEEAAEVASETETAAETAVENAPAETESAEGAEMSETDADAEDTVESAEQTEMSETETAAVETAEASEEEHEG